MEALLEFYKELKGNADLTYVSDVWLPEVGKNFVVIILCFGNIHVKVCI